MTFPVGKSRLLELLKSKHMSQAEFARKFKITDGFVSLIISNNRYFSYPLALAVSEFFGCTMEELHEPLDEL